MQKYRAISDGKAQNNQSTDLDLIFEPRPNRSIASVAPAGHAEVHVPDGDHTTKQTTHSYKSIELPYP